MKQHSNEPLEDCNSLHEAIEQNDSSTVIESEILSDPSVDVNVKNNDGFPALHVALRLKRWDVVSMLIKHGADIYARDKHNETALTNAVWILDDVPPDVFALLIDPTKINEAIDDCGNTLLHVVLSQGKWNLVPVLLNKGADNNAPNKNGSVPIHIALRNTRKSTSEEIVIHNTKTSITADELKSHLSSLISPTSINAQDSFGETPLHLVLDLGLWELVPFLLQRGADVNRCNQKGNIAMHVAIRNAVKSSPVDVAIRNTRQSISMDELEFLISFLISSTNINAQNSIGITPLHLALDAGLWQLVPLMLQSGADVNARNNKQGRTALHKAIFSHHCPSLDLVESLISHDNINMQDLSDETPLSLAARVKRWQILPLLLQTGADPNLHPDCSRDTSELELQFSPLDMVIRSQRWDIVLLIIKHGADINHFSGQFAMTPLIRALHARAPENVIKQLISNQNINKQDWDGSTPIMVAATKRRELVGLLLQYGADHTVLNCLPWTHRVPQRLPSLQEQAIAAIRRCMPIKSDEAFEALPLPESREKRIDLLYQLKLTRTAHFIRKNLDGN